MNVRVTIRTAAKPARVSGEQPRLDFAISLVIEDAQRGDGVIGTVEKALGEANKAIAKVLDTRPY